MRYTTTALIALAATAAAPSLAAPLAPITYNNADQACHYAGDKQHMVCTRDNHGYADGVPVTYDLGKRADAEVFLTRSDAYDVLARGMHDEMTAAEQAMRKRDAGDDVSFTIDHAGDLSKTKVTFSNGTVMPLSDLMAKQAATTPPPAAATHSKTTDDHSVNVGVGQGCKFGNGNINRRMATCQVAAVKRQVDQNYDGTSNGSNQGNICQFGNGNIGKRGSGASVRCIENGSPTYGPNGGTTVIYGKRMAGSTGCKWYDQRSIGDEDAIEAHAELHRRQTSSNQGNVCQYGNQRRQNGASYQCTQDCSPIYGPNGGSATYFTRRFDMSNADEVAAYHREVRSTLPNAAPLAERDEPCDGIPVGPVGPQVTYVTGKPQSKREVEDNIVAPPLFTHSPYIGGHGPVVRPDGIPFGFGPGPVIKTDKRAMPLEIDESDNTVPAKYRFRPLMVATSSTVKQPTTTTNKKRCINTPIAPVGPSVTYESYDQWKAQHSS